MRTHTEMSNRVAGRKNVTVCQAYAQTKEVKLGADDGNETHEILLFFIKQIDSTGRATKLIASIVTITVSFQLLSLASRVYIENCLNSTKPAVFLF